VKSWERAWTGDEILEGSKHWSLASDAGLLLHLKEFSTKLTNRTQALERKVDGLVFATKATEVGLHNTFNSLLMLSNTQYIENRVYEEEEDAGGAGGDGDGDGDGSKAGEDKELSHEQLEAILIPKYSEAVQIGTQVMKTVERDALDDDMDEDYGENIYAFDPLPYVIGTRAFEEDEFAGVLYVSDFSEEEIETDLDDEDPDALLDDVLVESGGRAAVDPFASGSELEEEVLSDDGGGATDAGSTGGLGTDLEKAVMRAKDRRTLAAEGDSDEAEWGSEDEDAAAQRRSRRSRMLGEEGGEDKDEEPKDFLSQLEVAIGGGPASAKKSRKKKESLFSEDEGDLFDDESANEAALADEADAPQPTAQKSSGLFDGGNDLFGEEEAAPSPAKKRASAKPASSLFDDSGDEGGDLFGLEKEAGTPATTVTEAKAVDTPPAKKKIPVGGKKLFDFGEEDAAPKSAAPKKDAPALSSGGLFDDEPEPAPVTKAAAPESLFDDEPAPAAAAKPTTKRGGGGLDSLFGEEEPAGPAKATPTKRVVKKPLDGFDSLFGDPMEDPVVEPAAAKATEVKTKKKKAPSSSLFDLDDGQGDDDLFGFKAAETPKKKPAGRKKIDTKSLFDFGEDDDTAGGLFGDAPKKETSAKPEEAEKETSAKPEGAKKSSAPVTPETETTETAAAAPPAAEVVTKKAPKATGASLFGDDGDDDGDLFGTAPAPASKPTAASQSSKKKTESLFGDDDDEDGGDFFSVKSTPASGKEGAPAKKGLSLFDDDMEGTTKDTEALFSGEGSERPSRARSTSTKKPEPKTASLFGEEVDVFAKAERDAPSKARGSKIRSIIDNIGGTVETSLMGGANLGGVGENSHFGGSGKGLGHGGETGQAGIPVEEVEIMTDKDASAASKKLTHLTKSRPSRAGRRAPTRSRGSGRSDLKTRASKAAPKAAHPAPKAAQPAKKSSSLFGEDDDDDFFGIPAAATVKKDAQAPSQAPKAAQASSKPNKKASSLFGDDDEDDVFAVPSAKSPPRVASEKVTAADELFAAPVVKKAPARSAADDILADPLDKEVSPKPTKEAAAVEVSKEEKPESSVVDTPAKSSARTAGVSVDEEDIFGSPVSKPVGKERQTTRESDDSGASASSAEPDAPAVESSQKSNTPAKKAAATPKKTVDVDDIFGNDELFADPLAKPSKSKARARKKKPIATDDIFDDIF